MTSDEVIIRGSAHSDRHVRSFKAELGRHIRVNPNPIAKHCLRTLANAGEDIATIAESAALADRLITRRRASSWGRSIDLTIPVVEVDRFSSATLEALTETLGYLTGDDWYIVLKKRNIPPPKEGYLPLSETAQYVVPYSDGLDSFAQARLLEHSVGPDSVLKVRAGSLQAGNSSAPLISVPRKFYAGHPRELTYRTRPFVYFSIAGIAAATISAESIVVGEAGQGALGPSFAVFGNEWPFRSTHPGFLRRLGRYLSLALGSQVRFQQPQLWKTKAEVLQDLRNKQIADGWLDTRSCSARPLQRQGFCGCGVCGGCLLRRVAVDAAGLLPKETPAFDIAGARPLGTRTDSAQRVLSDNERGIAIRAALSMEKFAKAGDDADFLQEVAVEVADVGEKPRVLELQRLIKQHAEEWTALIHGAPETSWLRQQFGL